MNRRDFQELSRLRRREAHILLRAGRPEGAYYLAGYAVECALKACIAKSTRRHDFPDREHTTRSYVHDLTRLLDTAGLQSAFDAAATNAAFRRNWAIVKAWKQTSRYERTIDIKGATAFYRAVASRRAGVLQWLRQYW